MGVETALAVGGLTASTIGSVASFAQAAKQNKLMKQAQADAEKAMNEARAKLDVNYYKQLAVQKEPYELEREALLSSGAQAIQAGVESERGAAATAGRIQMAQIEGQAGQRTAMGKELSDLAKLTVAEESRLRDEKAALDLAEAKGQQLMARDAQRAKTQAIQQGFAGLTSAIGQGAQLVSLYPKTTDNTTTPTTTTSSLSPEMQKQIQEGNKMPTTPTIEDFAKNPISGGEGIIGGKSQEEISNMDKMEYNIFVNSLSPEDRDKLNSIFDPFSFLNK